MMADGDIIVRTFITESTYDTHESEIVFHLRNGNAYYYRAKSLNIFAVKEVNDCERYGTTIDKLLVGYGFKLVKQTGSAF
jgi:hypothetical protein